MNIVKDDLSLNRAERIGNAVVCTYTDWHAYRSKSFPREFYEDNTLMKEFGGDINSASEVRGYLLQKVPEEEKEEVRKRFRTLELLNGLANKSS